MVRYRAAKNIFKFLFGEYFVDLDPPVVGVVKNNRGLKYNLKIPNISSRDFSRVLWRWRQTKIIKFREEKSGRVRIVLTEQGKKKLLEYQLDDMVIKKPKSWDGNWHIVIFDIPEKMKAARNALAGKIKSLGLVAFQKSVLIYPYHCRDEIDFVAQLFGVGRYVHYIITRSITNDELLRKRFGLDQAKVDTE